MTKSGPTVQIGERLRPHIKEFDFDIDGYAYALDMLRVPEQTIDSLLVQLHFSDRPYHKQDLWNFVTGQRQVTMGAYTLLKNAITLYPRSINHCLKEGETQHERFTDQVPNDLSALHNYVLAHETGHLVGMVADTEKELLHHLEAAETHYNMRRFASRSALAGAIIGAGVAETTGNSPAAGSSLGILAGGSVGLVAGAVRYRPQYMRDMKRKEKREMQAEDLTNDLSAVALLGRIIEIELKD